MNPNPGTSLSSSLSDFRILVQILEDLDGAESPNCSATRVPARAAFYSDDAAEQTAQTPLVTWKTPGLSFRTSVFLLSGQRYSIMPLILITGYPTSGKTHRALQIVSYLQTRTAPTPSATSPKTPLRIHHISDDTLSIPRRVYDLESKSANERSNNASEKDARAKVYGEVKRVLSQQDVVVLDAAGGGYIKGWRYQLYCEAKALRTPSCVVHVGTPVDKARSINEARLRRRDEGKEKEKEKDGGGDADDAHSTRRGAAAGVDGADEEPYERDTWENLVYRYEEPNGMARWDSPLFTVAWDDEAPPCVAIWDALVGPPADEQKGGVGVVVVRPNQATVLKPSSAEDYLYELDRATQEVLARITEWTRDHVGEGGGEVLLLLANANTAGGADGLERLVVQLPAEPVGLPALQRLRRQFIALNRQNAVSAARIRESFVGYLNGSFQAA